jgi:hypothetical protein
MVHFTMMDVSESSIKEFLRGGAGLKEPPGNMAVPREEQPWKAITIA